MPIKVVHHIRGYQELRRAPGVRADLEARARRVFEAVGGTSAGYEMSSRQGAARPQGRWRTSVAAVSWRARRAEVKQQRLLRAIDAARG